MRLILISLLLIIISPSYAFSGYFEFMDDVSGGLNENNKNGLNRAIESALKYQDRFNSITDDNSHDMKIRKRLLEKLMNILSSEPDGSDYAKKIIDNLIILGANDQKVESFFDNYLKNGHDKYIKQQIILHRN